MQSEMEAALIELDKAVDEHAGKIANVLRSDGLKADGATDTPEEMLVPAADFLRTMRLRIRFATERIHDLTRRTEA